MKTVSVNQMCVWYPQICELLKLGKSQSEAGCSTSKLWPKKKNCNTDMTTRSLGLWRIEITGGSAVLIH